MLLNTRRQLGRKGCGAMHLEIMCHMMCDLRDTTFSKKEWDKIDAVLCVNRMQNV